MEKLLHPVELKNVSYERNKTKFQKKIKCLTFLTATLMLMFFSFTSSASHFRYGNISWTRISETPTTVTIQLNVSTSWRLGTAQSSAYFVLSGGPTTGGVNVPLTVTTDPSGGWSNAVGSQITTLQKSSTPYLLAFNSGNKIGGLQNNSGGYWNVFTIVNTSAPGSSPVSTLPAIINMPVGVSAATYTIPASDPDANATLSYRFATPSEMAGEYLIYSPVTQPSGLSINPTTGQLTFNTNGKSINQQYNAGVVVTDNDGNQIFLDFLINITAFSTPPVFDYTTTPANGTTFNVIVGQNLSFPIKATDTDAGSTVSLSASGLPNFITTSNFSPAFPATGNPSQTTFSYTPGVAQIGSTIVLNFIATDNVGVQSSTSVTVKVVAEPAPTFTTQTLAQNSITQIQSSVPFSTKIEAVSSLGSNVSIGFSTGVPASASLSPTIPTSGANPGFTQLNWTPQPSDFGQKNLSFTAQITNVPTIFAVRNFSLIVNTPPVFTSTPSVTEVLFNTPFTYNITISDLDIPYGDVVDVESYGLPSWLTLTSTGNGTATLSGTPSITDGGVYHIKLEAADTYHHGNPSEVIQEFDLKVTVCNTVLSSSIVDVTCAGSSDGKIDLSVSGGKAPFVYSWSNGASSEDLEGVAAGNYTVTVTDANNCTETLTITVQTTPDVTLPIVLTQNLVINLSESGSATITAAQINNGSTDNCAIATIVLDKTSFTCANIGDNVVTLTVTDASGNSTSATATVTVKDVTAPTITAPISLTINNDLNNCGAVVNYVTPTAADNCSVVTSANVVNVLNPGQQFFDFANNRFETQFSPGLPLTFMPTDGQKMAVFLQSGSSTHYLYQNLTLPASGPILLTYDLKYTNHNGNFSENQFVAVQIRNASTNALLRTVFKTNPGAAVSTPMTSYSFDISEFAGQNVRLQIIDATINNFFFDVLLDNVKITGSSLVNGSFESDYTGWNVFSSSDFGGTWGIGYGPGTTIVQTAGLASGSIFPVGSTINTFKATDASGNVSESSFTVTVKDTQLPTVLTQNRTIQLDAAGNATITAADINDGSSDNCGIASVVLDKTSFTCSNVGNNTVTLTVTDVNGNISSKTATVIVEDKIAPIVLTQNRTIQLDAAGNATITAADINNGSSDNCGIASVVLSKTSFDCSKVGANTVTLTVTDVNGNVSTASATVTVQDNIAPTVITKNISVDLVGGNVSITAAQINNGSFDNCSIASLSINKTSFDCSSIGNHTVTLTVTDVNGNVSNATAVVTVVGELTTSSIASVPTSNTYTGGVSTNLYLGYGAQSTTLQVSNLVSGGNGVDPRSYTYQWTGTGLSSTTSGSPVFTPTAAGFYNFSVIITNKYGCKSTASISICVKDIREKDKNGKFSGKVFICHAPPGNVGNSNTLSISVNAVPSHLSQHSFDRLGTCADAPCTSTGLATNSVGGTSTENNVLITDLNVNSTEFLAYPNPFGKQTTVRFTLPYQDDNATLDIYDLKGTKIQTLFNGNANAQTTYEVQFNGQNLSAGTYFFRLITAKEVKNFKVIMSE